MKKRTASNQASTPETIHLVVQKYTSANHSSMYLLGAFRDHAEAMKLFNARAAVLSRSSSKICELIERVCLFFQKSEAVIVLKVITQPLDIDEYTQI